MEVTVFLGLPGGMCGRRGEIREGSEIQNCRILEKDIGKKFFKSSFVSCTVLVQHARPFPTGRAADLIESPLGGDHRRPSVLDNRERIIGSWRFGFLGVLGVLGVLGAQGGTDISFVALVGTFWNKI